MLHAEVKISLADLDRLRGNLTKSEADNIELRKLVDSLRVTAAFQESDAGSDARRDYPLDGTRMVRALYLSLRLNCFGIGNLDPLTVRGWPWAELLELAELMPQLPGLPPEIVELWLDWRIFARRTAEWEAARANGTEKEKLAEENSAKTPGAFYGEPEQPGIGQ